MRCTTADHLSVSFRFLLLIPLSVTPVSTTPVAAFTAMEQQLALQLTSSDGSVPIGWRMGTQKHEVAQHVRSLVPFLSWLFQCAAEPQGCCHDHRN